MRSLSELKSHVERSTGAFSILSQRSSELSAMASQNASVGCSIEEAQVFLQGVAQETQTKLQIHIQDIVQLALDACFPGEYNFQVKFEIKRGTTEAAIYFTKEGERVNPMDSSGGGAVDITAFALRIACWTLAQTRNTILLDEPFRFLSQDLQPRAAEIMKELSHKLNLQFICVTHNPAITEVADRIIENRLVKNVSKQTVKE